MPVLIVVGLFLLFCFLWGVASLFGNAKDAARRWSKHRHIQRSAQDAAPAPLIEHPYEIGLADTSQSANEAGPTAPSPSESLKSGSCTEHMLAQLKEASALYQSGALTRPEFDQLKQKILSGTSDAI